MKSTQKTRHALVTSVVCMVLCCAMLLGTTFAWFTDSVTNTGNRIEAGTLDVDLLMHNGTQYESISNGSGDIFSATGGNGIKWEPGKTEIVYLEVQNSGTLALNYDLLLNVVDGDPGLVGSLDYVILNDTQYGDLADISDWDGLVDKATQNSPSTGITNQIVAGETTATSDGFLEAGKATYFAMAVHMDEMADNQYQNGSITIDVKLLAKQAPFEEDGFGNSDYDKDAPDPWIANVVGTVTDAAAETKLTDAASGVTVVVPENTLKQGDTVSLTVEKTEETSNSLTYEIDFKVNGQTPATPLSNAIKAEIDIGTGLSNVRVTHNGVEMTEADTGADQTYWYNVDTGILTIATASFSPFKISFDPPVVTIGDTGYASLNDAVEAAKSGDTITLQQDVVVDEVVSYSDPWGEPGEAGVTRLRNITIDGGGHTITAPQDGYLFGDVRNSTIKNVTLQLRGHGAAYFTWNVTFENVSAVGEAVFNGGNEGAFVTYHYSGTLTFKDCTNKATLSSGGSWGNYNAVFVGYPVAAGSVITFDGCVNEGSLVCGTAAMFVANPHYTAFTMNIENCANNGLIQATYAEDASYRPNLITAVTNDGTNTLLTVNAGGKKYKGVNGNNSIYNVPVAGNAIVNGPKDASLAISLNGDGSFTVSPTMIGGVDHYIVSYSVYSTLVAGGSQQHMICEELPANGSLTTQLKYQEFVDQQWVDEHPTAVQSTWNTYTIYTLEGKSYYLLPDADLTTVTLNGTPKLGTFCAVSAYNAQNELLASAQCGL